MSVPVSVAMATCNGEKYIGAQIDSLLRQELPPVEIIVCDDASTDGTPAFLADYEAKGLIRFYRNDTRLGVIANFRKACSLCAAGNFVALCDQDDYWHTNKLRDCVTLLETIDTGSPGLVFSDLTLADDSLREISPSFWEVLDIDPAQESIGSLLYGNFITGCTLLMNAEMRRAFMEIPDTGIMMHDAWLGLIAFTFGEYRYIRQPLVQYRQHGGNVTYVANRQDSLAGKIAKNIGQMLNNQRYLAAELLMAGTFYKQYANRLTPAQIASFKDFIALRHASFLKKKRSALAARAYRGSHKI